MAKESAGILVFRRVQDRVDVLLVHPGGPFWGKKDSWSIPKGELDPDEDRMTAATREFEEEVGFKPPGGARIDLGESRQSGSKTNYMWAVEGNPDLRNFKSNTFTMQWPPKSGQEQEFPENDRAGWFELSMAKTKLYKAQISFIDRLAASLGVNLEQPPVPEQQSLL